MWNNMTRLACVRSATAGSCRATPFGSAMYAVSVPTNSAGRRIIYVKVLHDDVWHRGAPPVPGQILAWNCEMGLHYTQAWTTATDEVRDEAEATHQAKTKQYSHLHMSCLRNQSRENHEMCLGMSYSNEN